jgi:hypothetical protein
MREGRSRGSRRGNRPGAAIVATRSSRRPRHSQSSPSSSSHSVASVRHTILVLTSARLYLRGERRSWTAAKQPGQQRTDLLFCVTVAVLWQELLSSRRFPDVSWRRPEQDRQNGFRAWTERRSRRLRREESQTRPLARPATGACSSKPVSINSVGRQDASTCFDALDFAGRRTDESSIRFRRDNH